MSHRSQSPDGRSPSLSRVLIVAGWLVVTILARLTIAPQEPDSRIHTRADADFYIGLAWQAENGAIAGRDFSSTWSAVPQFLALQAARFHARNDFLASMPLVYLFLSGFGTLCLALTLLLAPWLRTWQILIALLLILSFSLPFVHPISRVGSAFLALVLFSRACLAQGRWTTFLSITAGALCFVVQLVSPDFAVYALASLASAPVLLLLRQRSFPKGFTISPSLVSRAVLYTLLTVLTLNALLAVLYSATSLVNKPLGFYHQSLWETITTYSQTVGRPWTLDPATTAILVSATLATGALGLWRIARGKEHESLGLAILLPFTFFAIQGALIRSDPGHITLASLPLFVLWTILQPTQCRRILRWAIWVLIGFLWLAAWPDSLAPILTKDEFRKRDVNPLNAWQLVSNGTVEAEANPTEMAKLESASEGPVFVFPYQNRLGAWLERPLLTPYHQVYAAHTVAMQRKLVAELEAAGDELTVIYALDDLKSWGFDGGQSITRSPVVFRYLLDQFDATPEKIVDGGYLILKKRRDKRSIHWRQIAFEQHYPHPGEIQLTFEEAIPCSLLAVDMTMEYPSFRAARWLIPLRATAHRPDGIAGMSRIIPIALGESFRTYVSVVRGQAFARLFDDSDGAPNKTLRRLDLEVDRGDWMSLRPSSIVVERLSCY